MDPKSQVHTLPRRVLKIWLVLTSLYGDVLLKVGLGLDPLG